MPDAPWRCSQCGTVNEPVANSCRTCGKWPSLFDLQDSVVEDVDYDLPQRSVAEPEAYVPDTFEPEVVETETFEPEPLETEPSRRPPEEEPEGKPPREVDVRDRPARAARVFRDLVLLLRPVTRRSSS